MPNLQPKPFSIEKELEKLSLYKYHPNGIVNVSFNRLMDILDGKVEIVDPSNPFTYLLETSCLNTAFAIQEHTLLMRKLYPRLANNYNDLFLHMSDFDYLGIFAEPAYGNVIFNILVNDFITKAKYDPVQNEYVLKIPRHLKITVDDYVFTSTSAIIIRRTESGVYDVKYENQDFNNIFPVTTNYINFYIYKVNAEETYITFIIKLPEVDIESIEIPVEKNKLFKNVITYNPKRDFYFFRAFYKNNNEWKEMIVTHTDEVYDVYKPTCIIDVNTEDHTINYYIPSIYLNSEQIENKVKFLVYTTKGPINVNFSKYKIADFNSEYNPVFPEIELDETTRPLQVITKVIYITDKVIGGKSSLDFNTVKNYVIDNSIGNRKLPITNKQLNFLSEQNNFYLIKNVDTITNREFLLSVQIPNASTRYPITKLNLGLLEYKTTISKLRSNGDNIISADPNAIIIPEGTIFKLEEDGLKLLTGIEQTNITNLSDHNLLSELNNNTYLSTFYHYVLINKEDHLYLRAYDLESNNISNINFKEFNPTAKIGINTSNIAIAKTPNGYTITILSNIKKYVSSINETNVKPYIVYTDTSGSKFYLEGNLFTTINNNPIYKILLDTKYYIDTDNKIHITNFKDVNNNNVTLAIDIDSKLEIVYVSSVIPPNFVTSKIDNYIYYSYLADDRCVVTLEEINVKFADYLEYLYTGLHSSVGDSLYEIYDEDVPLRYTSNVYDSNNNIIHYVNEIVLDSNGNPIIQHRKGDVKYDPNGNPILIPMGDYNIYMNLLFIDYKAVIANTDNMINYKKYIRDFLTEKIVENAKHIQNELLENTVAYVSVPKNIDFILVKTSGRTIAVNSLQSLVIELHVDKNIYDNLELRNTIEYTIIKEVDTYFSNNFKLSKSLLHDMLYRELKEYVKNISILRFNDLNADYLELLDKNTKIGLNKKLVMEGGKYNLKEDIDIRFIKI